MKASYPAFHRAWADAAGSARPLTAEGPGTALGLDQVRVRGRGLRKQGRRLPIRLEPTDARGES